VTAAIKSVLTANDCCVVHLVERIVNTVSNGLEIVMMVIGTNVASAEISRKLC